MKIYSPHYRDLNHVGPLKTNSCRNQIHCMLKIYTCTFIAIKCLRYFLFFVQFSHAFTNICLFCFYLNQLSMKQAVCNIGWWYMSKALIISFISLLFHWKMWLNSAKIILPFFLGGGFNFWVNFINMFGEIPKFLTKSICLHICISLEFSYD